VIWGGEFGRTPFLQGKIEEVKQWGRDHHPYGFTLHGGRRGEARVQLRGDRRVRLQRVENKVHVHDFQATVLHLLGINHEKAHP
jgi:hypothetical protein